MNDTKITSDLFLDLLNHTTAMKNYSHCNPTSNMPMGIELGILHTKLDQLANELDHKERIKNCSFGKFKEQPEDEEEYDDDDQTPYEEDDELSCFKKLVMEKEKNLTLNEEFEELEAQIQDWKDDQKSLMERLETLQHLFEMLLRLDHIHPTSIDRVIKDLASLTKPEEYYYSLLPGKTLRMEP